jgi:tetratricopeptide (TPR) repeat protein
LGLTETPVQQIHGVGEVSGAGALDQKSEVLAELEQIRRVGFLPPQQFTILKYLVDEELAGRGADIKAWSVAVFALGRPESFDPKDDKIVAVQVSRLRAALKKYYEASPPASVRVVLSVAPQGYRPVFAEPRAIQRLDAQSRLDLDQAQEAMDRLTIPALHKALKLLSRVLDLYPDHPLVLAMKADAHCFLAMHGAPPLPEVLKADALCRRALELSPEMPQALLTYGYSQAVLRKWDLAHQTLRRAAQTNDLWRDSVVHPGYSAYLISQGRVDEAVRLTEVAFTMRGGYYGLPTAPSAIVYADLAFVQILAGDLKKARVTLQTALAKSNFYMLHLYLAMLCEAEGNPQEAVDVLRSVSLPFSESAMTWAVKGMFYGLAGSRSHAQLALVKLRAAKALGFYVPASQFAIAYLGLKDYEASLHWLRRVADDYDPVFLWIGYFPFFRHLTHLPAFHDLLQSLGLHWGWMVPRDNERAS